MHMLLMFGLLRYCYRSCQLFGWLTVDTQVSVLCIERDVIRCRCVDFCSKINDNSSEVVFIGV